MAKIVDSWNRMISAGGPAEVGLHVQEDIFDRSLGQSGARLRNEDRNTEISGVQAVAGMTVCDQCLNYATVKW